MSFYLFKAQTDSQPAQLLLDGDVASKSWAWWGDVDAQAFSRELVKHGDIDVVINSPGGDVFAGAQIYSLLKAHRGKVTVKVAGLAGSIASVIAMAGDEVLMSPAGCMMIHQPWTRASGDAREMEKTAAMLDEISGSLVNAYVAKTGKSENEIRRLMDAETWMNARSAVEMGFADGIWEEGREQYAPAAAAMMQTGQRNSEKSVLNRAREWQQHDEGNLTPLHDLRVNGEPDAISLPAFMAQSVTLPADEDAAANAQASADLARKKRRLKLLADVSRMD